MGYNSVTASLLHDTINDTEMMIDVYFFMWCNGVIILVKKVSILFDYHSF